MMQFELKPAALFCRLLVIFLAWSGASRLSAQNPEDALPASDVPAVREAKPDIYYLKDGDKLQPVLGFTLEDFERLLSASGKGGEKIEAPDFSFDQLTIEGKVTGDATSRFARLSIDVGVTPRAKGWVRVPLRLGTAALETAETSDAPNGYVTFDPAAKEYAAWLKGADTPQRLKLTMVVNVVAAEGSEEFSLQLPRARSSRFVLIAPVKNAIGKVPEGVVLESTTHKENETVFTIVGPGGPFTFNWRDPAARPATLFESTGAISVHMDGAAVRSEAQLTVRSFSGEFDRFRVRLPPGAMLTGEESEDYSLTVVEENAASPDEGRGKLVEAVLRAKTQGPVTIELVTQSTGAVAQSRAVELGGFDVQNAVRQWGQVAVHVGSEWEIRWGERRQVRQIDDLPAELRGAVPVAGFEFYAQPFSLQAHVVPRVTRLSVEPNYKVRVGARVASLEGVLRYRVRGAPLFSLTLDARGWTITEAGPSDLIDPLALSEAAEGGALTIPLLKPLAGDAEVEIRAVRNIEQGASSLEFQLPAPRADLPAATTLAVVAESGVELTPNSRLQGLESLGSRAPAGGKGEAAQQFRGDVQTAHYAADYRILPQSIQVAVRSRIRVEESAARVEQSLSYSVQHEPLAAILLRVPREVLQRGDMQIMTEGQLLSTFAPEDSAEDDGAAQIRVVLPSPAVEKRDLLIRYSTPIASLASGASTMPELPLVMPLQGTIAANAVTISAEEGFLVQSRSSDWNELAESGDEQEPELRLSAASPLSAVSIVVHRLSEERGGGVTLEKGWIHSDLLVANTRRERASFRFRTKLKSLLVALPEGARGVEAMLDGVPVSLRAGKEGETRIPVGVVADRSSRLLELQYRVESSRDPGRLRLVAPKIQNSIGAPRVYWELLLPRHTHVLETPAGLVSEHRWAWKTFYVGREPLLNSSELERWMGSSAAVNTPRGANRYLFSATGPPPPLALRAMGSSTIVLSGAGAALVLGLLGIYVPRLRRAPVWLAAGILIFSALILFPETSVLAAQAVLVGVALTCLAVWLEKVESRRRRRAVFPAPASSFRGSTRSQPAPVVAGSHSSTRTAFAGPPDVEFDS